MKAILLVVIFLHNFAYNAGTYYLALFFQVSSISIQFVMKCSEFVPNSANRPYTVTPQYVQASLCFRILWVRR